MRSIAGLPCQMGFWLRSSMRFSLRGERHGFALSSPFFREMAVLVFVEIRPAKRVVQKRCICVRRQITYQVIPALGERAYQLIVCEPLELMQFEARCGVHVLRCQCPAFRIV